MRCIISSLNLNKRLHSTISVVRENEKIVNRLINVKPTHSKAKLDKDWADREKLLHNISRYRHPWRNPNEIQKKQLENGDGEVEMEPRCVITSDSP